MQGRCAGGVQINSLIGVQYLEANIMSHFLSMHEGRKGRHKARKSSYPLP